MINFIKGVWRGLTKTREQDIDKLINIIKDNQCTPKDNLKEDISEPVISFVKTVMENPKRFYIENLFVGEGDCKYYKAHIKDLQTKEIFTCDYYGKYWGNLYSWHTLDNNINWITIEEFNYVINKLKVFYKTKKNKLDEIKQARIDRVSQRKDKVERQRLIEIYTI